MGDTLVGALKTLFCLNRWNIQPCVETWTEAENISMCTHAVYAAGKLTNLDDHSLKHAVKRTLLKSLNKHWLSDISAPIRELMQEHSEEGWKGIRQDAARETARLFPSEVAPTLLGYLTMSGDYNVNGNGNKDIIENLVEYIQYRVALIECEANKFIFKESYKKKEEKLKFSVESIKKRSVLLKDVEFEQGDLDKYLFLIRNLKHVRRWNRINRFIESSVLAHTFIVAFLALLFSEARSSQLIIDNEEDPQYNCILLALFHDVPEMLTGDIITPVKQLIARYDKTLIDKIENIKTSEMLEDLPKAISNDIKQKKLFVEPSKDQPFSVSSMVKDCDILAGMLECAFEISVGNENPEIVEAYTYYLNALQNSEWDVIREFSLRVRYELENGLF